MLIRKTLKTLLKSGLKVLVVASIFLSLAAYGQFAKTTLKQHQEAIDFYQEIIEGEQAWIASMQLPSGVLPQRPLSQQTASVIPYFSAMAAMALLEYQPEMYVEQVFAYLEWVFSRLNDAQSDFYSIDGTLSNFTLTLLPDGSFEERATKYDSVDAYAALNLSLLLKAYHVSQDTAFFTQHETDIQRIVKALLSTRLANGLSAVSVNNQTQYLMDNIEVQVGLQDGIYLIELMLPHSNNAQALKDLQIELIEWAHMNATAIEHYLWSESEQRYHIGLSANTQIIEFKSWDRFYPDAVAQLFPILHQTIDLNDERAKQLYARFNKTYDWQTVSFRAEGNFYWTMIVYVAALMGDTDRVKAYLGIYKDLYMPAHPYPLYSAESAWIVRASLQMIEHHQASMRRIDPLSLFH